VSKELYKLYRPRSLDDVIGNDVAVSFLRDVLEGDAVPHTLLFHGPSGCGKTTLARIVSRELNCSKLDLHEMNCSSFRGIDTIREITRTMILAPTAGDVRVWILDEFHQMSKDGQNAALKILEDTPDHVYFLLCTTDPQKLLPAIRSRATSVECEPLSLNEMEKLVKLVCRKEEIKLDSKVLDKLIELAEGRARTALVMLGKVSKLSKEQQIKALQHAKDEENVAIDLCRLLVNKKGRPSWKAVAKCLKDLKEETEAVRWAVLGYARSGLVDGWCDPDLCEEVISLFQDNFWDSKDAGLAAACYRVTVGRG
jgi:DNA polymerase-3 subunit gamma/tau